MLDFSRGKDEHVHTGRIGHMGQRQNASIPTCILSCIASIVLRLYDSGVLAGDERTRANRLFATDTIPL